MCRNGVDTERFSPLPQPNLQRPTAIFIGNGFVRKGLATALEALVHAPEFQLQVIGTDRRLAAYKSLSRKLRVDERVFFLGHRSNPEFFIKKAHVLVLPTRYDPSANVCLEAMACGVPFVSTPKNGATEIAPFDWMACPSDPIAFAKSMQVSLREVGVGDKCRQIALNHRSELAYERLRKCLMSQ